MKHKGDYSNVEYVTFDKERKVINYFVDLIDDGKKEKVQKGEEIAYSKKKYDEIVTSMKRIEKIEKIIDETTNKETGVKVYYKNNKKPKILSIEEYKQLLKLKKEQDLIEYHKEILSGNYSNVEYVEVYQPKNKKYSKITFYGNISEKAGKNPEKLNAEYKVTKKITKIQDFINIVENMKKIEHMRYITDKDSIIKKGMYVKYKDEEKEKYFPIDCEQNISYISNIQSKKVSLGTKTKEQGEGKSKPTANNEKTAKKKDKKKDKKIKGKIVLATAAIATIAIIACCAKTKIEKGKNNGPVTPTSPSISTTPTSTPAPEEPKEEINQVDKLHEELVIKQNMVVEKEVLKAIIEGLNGKYDSYKELTNEEQEKQSFDVINTVIAIVENNLNIEGEVVSLSEYVEDNDKKAINSIFEKRVELLKKSANHSNAEDFKAERNEFLKDINQYVKTNDFMISSDLAKVYNTVLYNSSFAKWFDHTERYTIEKEGEKREYFYKYWKQDSEKGSDLIFVTEIDQLGNMIFYDRNGNRRKMEETYNMEEVGQESYLNSIMIQGLYDYQIGISEKTLDSDCEIEQGKTY